MSPGGVTPLGPRTALPDRGPPTEDPAYRADLALYRLSQEARAHFEASGLSAREVASRLGTSPTQLYRLLDPTNYTKSLRQLVGLLYVLGCEVDVHVSERSTPAAS